MTLQSLQTAIVADCSLDSNGQGMFDHAPMLIFSQPLLGLLLNSFPSYMGPNKVSNTSKVK